MTLPKLASIVPMLAVLAGCTGNMAPGASPSAAPGASALPSAQPSAAAAASKLTEEIVKAHVTKLEQALVGKESAHTKVDLTFQAVEIGTPRAANMQDDIDGAHGDTIYPARVKYTSFRSWPSGETRTLEIYYAYNFYVDDFGGWGAIGLGPVR